jgi:hypothetical protein
LELYACISAAAILCTSNGKGILIAFK